MAEETTSMAPVNQPKGDMTTPLMSKEELAEFNGAMEENISVASIRHARLAIVQTGTPEVSEGVPGYKPGMLMTNTEKQVLSTYSKMPWLLKSGVNPEEVKAAHWLEVLVVYKLPDEYIEWIPKSERKDGDGLWRWKTLERTKEVLQGLPDWRGGWWKKSDTQPSPPVTENCNLLLVPLLPDGNFVGGPLVASFSRTSFKAGEKLVNACRQHLHMKLPWHGRTYYLYTEFKENEKGKYYVLRYARGREITQLPGWEEKHKVCLETCRALADPTKSEFPDGKDGFKSRGRIRQENLIASAVIFTDEDSDGEGAPDDFTTDHFAEEGGEPAF